MCVCVGWFSASSSSVPRYCCFVCVCSINTCRMFAYTGIRFWKPKPKPNTGNKLKYNRAAFILYFGELPTLLVPILWTMYVGYQIQQTVFTGCVWGVWPSNRAFPFAHNINARHQTKISSNCYALLGVGGIGGNVCAGTTVLWQRISILPSK